MNRCSNLINKGLVLQPQFQNKKRGKGNGLNRVSTYCKLEVVADAQHNQTRLSEAAPTDPATMDVAVP